jgi:hypothetical protein
MPWLRIVGEDAFGQKLAKADERNADAAHIENCCAFGFAAIATRAAPLDVVPLQVLHCFEQAGAPAIEGVIVSQRQHVETGVAQRLRVLGFGFEHEALDDFCAFACDGTFQVAEGNVGPAQQGRAFAEGVGEAVPLDLLRHAAVEQNIAHGIKCYLCVSCRLRCAALLRYSALLQSSRLLPRRGLCAAAPD